MSVNSSFFSNASLLLLYVSSTNSSLNPDTPLCFKYKSTFFIFTSFSVTNILLLLPLSILVLYLGLQRWWKRLSASRATTSHSDIFTYHIVAMEMIGIFGCGLYCCGVLVNVPWVIMLGVNFFYVTSNGEIFLHMLTSVDRYLAVVHPITYMQLRNRGGVRIRNVTIGCVWLLYLGLSVLQSLAANFSILQAFFFLTLSIIVVSYCSLSVLRALIRPGPGEEGRDRKQVDKSKMRAFHTIMAIMGALLVRFGGQLFVVVIYSSALRQDIRCGILVSGIWFCLPSSLVSPLLFLHRAGKLQWCKKNYDSG